MWWPSGCSAGSIRRHRLFHELLEHRYYLSEAAALKSVLSFRPEERSILGNP